MRSFVAINLPPSVKSDIDEITNRLRQDSPPARWVPAENVHITLKFLDEVATDLVRPVVAAVRKAVREQSRFEIRFGGFGVFPNPGRARVFWVGMEAGVDILKQLAHEIDLAVNKLGFSREKRPFSAHLTLARLRQPGPADSLLEAAAEIPYCSEPILVEQIDLMQSVLSREGAEYSILESINLKKT